MINTRVIEHYGDWLIENSVEYLIKFLIVLSIFFIGRWFARKVVQLLRAAMERANADATLISFLSNVVYAALIIMVIMIAVSLVGINTSSFLAIFGAIGLAIGLALKDTLSNVGAAVLIILFRPFKAGDYIEVSKIAGVVQTISLFSTTLVTMDNRSIIVPNGKLIADNIINYTMNQQRRIDMVFEVDYATHLGEAKEVIMEVLIAHEKVLAEPAPVVVVGSLGSNGISLFVRPWVAVEEYWAVTFDLNEQIKAAFDHHNIAIPFPQMNVHIERD